MNKNVMLHVDSRCSIHDKTSIKCWSVCSTFRINDLKWKTYDLTIYRKMKFLISSQSLSIIITYNNFNIIKIKENCSSLAANIWKFNNHIQIPQRLCYIFRTVFEKRLQHKSFTKTKKTYALKLRSKLLWNKSSGSSISQVRMKQAKLAQNIYFSRCATLKKWLQLIA